MIPRAVAPRRVSDRARKVLDSHWTAHGYCVPNPDTYPWQWLWDSCFHAVAWAHLGDERGLIEVGSVLSGIDADGFVPHMRYPGDPTFASDFWGRAGASSITQPPMYGHALAELHRLGFEPDEAVLARATSGLRFMLDRRRRSSDGLVLACHPWETGCDDSPRWDHWRPLSTADEWYARKGSFVRSIERAPGGAPLHNPDFVAAPAGFNALVAFNARELAAITDDAALRADADALAEVLDDRWDGRTWADGGEAAAGSGRVRTLDALLPALLGGPNSAAALADVTDPRSFGAPYGPRAVSGQEPAYDPKAYWRGPAWPQLSYLCWLAARTAGLEAVASSVAASFLAGVAASGWAEYWDPETGEGLGARPQSWASLVAVVISEVVEPRRA